MILEFAANGLHARKILQFDPENYVFSFQTSLDEGWKESSASACLARRTSAINPFRRILPERTRFIRSMPRIKRSRCAASRIPQDVHHPRVGVEDQYFLAMFLLRRHSDSVKVAQTGVSRRRRQTGSDIPLSAACPGRKPVRVYIGPEAARLAGQSRPQLSAVVRLWLFRVHREAAGRTSCSGFTATSAISVGRSFCSRVALNLVLFPLRLKQQVSMLKMQKIQPQMRTLQDQYKKLKANDPRRAEVQTEMMGLYKEHGVNPMGGCLPLLLQMPLLFGFYSALAYSIELTAGALDLVDQGSYPSTDPYYVIPILMAVSMFVQQKMTPNNVDPAQAKMMMIMPLMFTFMFLFYSSGLTLYWLTGSVIGIGQQVFINKYWSPQAEAKLQARSQTRRTVEE